MPEGERLDALRQIFKRTARLEMIDEREIWACAHHLMQRYGDAAGLHAAQRADELLAADDHEGCRTWLSILKRIEALSDLAPHNTLQ